MSFLKQQFIKNLGGMHFEKSVKVKDPPRFPKVIERYEQESTKAFKDETEDMFVSITKLLVSYAK